MHALVCPSCGGVYMPAAESDIKMCATPGCSHEGQPLAPRELEESETMICPVCQGRFLISVNHHH